MHPSKKILLPKYQKKVEAETKIVLNQKTLKQRKEFLERIFEGGKGFVERVKKYGRNEKGEKLDLQNWYCELLELIGDFRISEVHTSGCAQLGKTLSSTLLIADTVISGKLNCAWFYSTRDNRDLNVPEQFRPVADSYLEAYEAEHGVKLRQSKDSDNNSRYQIEGCTAIFSYASTSKPTESRKNLSRVGSAAASFTANLLFVEEKSQIPAESFDPLPRRLDASLIATKPLRCLGTSASGAGVESAIPNCQYNFYPHYKCPKCSIVKPLDPKGCLLQEVDIKDPLGKPKKSYFSASGKPVKWFYKDLNNPVETAFIACKNCETELTEDIRVNAHYRCLNTGKSLRKFLDSLPKGIPDQRLKCYISISPLCRKSKLNIAANIIDSGINCTDGADWQQQALGHASQVSQGSLTLEILEASWNAPFEPIHERYLPKTFVVAGVDCGTNSDWLTISKFHLPLNWRSLTANELMEKSKREILFMSDVIRDDIPSILKQFNTDFGLIDVDPSRESAFNVSKKSVLSIADQRGGLREIWKMDKVSDGGISYDCYLVRNEKFLNQGLDAFLYTDEKGHSMVKLPNFDHWKGNPSPLSPIKHLTSPYKDASGWNRARDKIDDLYYSLCFSEFAALIYLDGISSNGADWIAMS